MKRFKSPGQIQRLHSDHDKFSYLFHLRRDHVGAARRRAARARAFEVWAEVAVCKLICVTVAANKLSSKLHSSASNLTMPTAPDRGVALKVRLIHDLRERTRLIKDPAFLKLSGTSV